MKPIKKEEGCFVTWKPHKYRVSLWLTAIGLALLPTLPLVYAAVVATPCLGWLVVPPAEGTPEAPSVGADSLELSLFFVAVSMIVGVIVSWVYESNR